MKIKRFEEKIMLITGGTHGMGLEVAIAAAQEGAQVIICGRDEGKGIQAVVAGSEAGEKLHFMVCDIEREDDVERLINRVTTEFGGLDFAFNNAGITSQYARLAESDVDAWRKVIDVNLIGTYLSMRYEIAAMLRRGGGAIVNNSSCVGIMAIPAQSAYVASKAAVIGLTQSAAIDYAHNDSGVQVRINAIAPGPISGGMNSEKNLSNNPARTEKKINATAMRRLGTPVEVASAVLWLLSSESSYVTGAVIPVDGGVTAGKF